MLTQNLTQLYYSLHFRADEEQQVGGFQRNWHWGSVSFNSSTCHRQLYRTAKLALTFSISHHMSQTAIPYNGIGNGVQYYPVVVYVTDIYTMHTGFALKY